MQSDLLGSAKWESFQGYDNEKALSGWGVVIGRPLPQQDEPVGSKENILVFPTDRHYLSVAPTRSGKGVSLIVPNLLQYKGSAIVIDPKGENGANAN